MIEMRGAYREAKLAIAAESPKKTCNMRLVRVSTKMAHREPTVENEKC